MNRLEQAFAQAKRTYPQPWTSETVSSLEGDLDGVELEEAHYPHTWQLVNASTASHGLQPESMLVLQEWRPKSRVPANHWGFMIARDELKSVQVALIS